MAIPKVIHYCWFGGKDMPEKEKSCVATWEKFFPDYEFKMWNVIFAISPANITNSIFCCNHIFLPPLNRYLVQ